MRWLRRQRTLNKSAVVERPKVLGVITYTIYTLYIIISPVATLDSDILTVHSSVQTSIEKIISYEVSMRMPYEDVFLFKRR